MCLNCSWSENDIFFINDIFSEYSRVYSWEELQIQYNININFMDYFSVLSAIPKAWKEKIAGAKILDHIKCNLIEKYGEMGSFVNF